MTRGLFLDPFFVYMTDFSVLKRADYSGTKKGTVAAYRVDPKH